MAGRNGPEGEGRREESLRKRKNRQKGTKRNGSVAKEAPPKKGKHPARRSIPKGGHGSKEQSWERENAFRRKNLPKAGQPPAADGKLCMQKRLANWVVRPGLTGGTLDPVHPEKRENSC